MASPASFHSQRPQQQPSLPPAVASRPSCSCCCCVRRIILHHQHHHINQQLFRAQFLPPPWIPRDFHFFLNPRLGAPPPALSHPEGQRGVTTQDAVDTGTLVTPEDISSSRLFEAAGRENMNGEEVLGEEEGEEEEEEPVYVLTDEWAEFFAKSEAKRQLERRRKKKQQQQQKVRTR